VHAQRRGGVELDVVAGGQARGRCLAEHRQQALVQLARARVAERDLALGSHELSGTHRLDDAHLECSSKADGGGSSDALRAIRVSAASPIAASTST
jgi:hypothetical protein